jgi:beta-glucosidase-like glycosyl hydrolase
MKKVTAISLSLAMFVSLAPVPGITTDVRAEEVTNVKSAKTSTILPYQDTSLSFEERAADLVSRMTLEEKVSQIGNSAPAITRLGVAKYDYWKEGLHGVARQGAATSFPMSLAMSNTWDRNLIYSAADITGTEARGKNNTTNLSYWSPTINMARDPRWGRNDETYGEDPYLTEEYGIQFVKGMQGNDPKYLKVISTIKHFLANNSESERRKGTSVMDERTLREYYTRHFKDVVEKANPASVMASYNASTVTRNGKTLYDYIPSAANQYTLIDLLRRNWGFSGYVTGDCGAVEDLYKLPQYKQALFPGQDISKIPESASIAKGIQAGVDTDCGSAAQPRGYEAVQKGFMSEADLDMAVYHLFLQRMRTGEFDLAADVPYRSITNAVVEAPEHAAVAQRAAEESWVLLKNQDDILPLASTAKNIAVVGPLADTVVLGDYSGTPSTQISPYVGIKQEISSVNPTATVSYVDGVLDSTQLCNVKSITLTLEDGTTRAVDLTKATGVAGMTLSGNGFTSVTRKATACIPAVNLSKVVSVKAEMATGIASPGAKLKLLYGNGGPDVADILTTSTTDLNTYSTCTGAYTGSGGGYNGTVDLYLAVEPQTPAFSVDKYKADLDAADVIIAYAGTTLTDSSESHDRSSISLPASQAHINAVTAAYPKKTVVVMQTVGQIDVAPFINNAKAILWTSYNGQMQGTALGKILTGQVNPSGKLSTTWYAPAYLNTMTVNTTAVTGSDGIQRWYNNYNIRKTDSFPGRTYQYYSGTPTFSFGYGLSYTNYAYSNITLSTNTVDANGKITVTADVKNIGEKDGSEIVQLYITPAGGDGVNLPLKQLKGFEKVSLKAGETKTVTLDVEIKDINFFDEASQKIYVPTGVYTVMVGKNATDANALKAQFTVTGTLNSTLKTVKTMPTGLSVYGKAFPLGSQSEPINGVDAKLSAVMTDEKVYDLNNAKVTYTSANPDVAIVDTTGHVTSGKQSGVTTITASVTIDGVTKTDTFPIVSQITEKTNTTTMHENGTSYIKDGVIHYGVGSLDTFENMAAKNQLISEANPLQIKMIPDFDATYSDATVTWTIEPLDKYKDSINRATASQNAGWVTDELSATVSKDGVVSVSKYGKFAVKATAVKSGGMTCVAQQTIFADIQLEAEYVSEGLYMTSVTDSAVSGGKALDSNLNPSGYAMYRNLDWTNLGMLEIHVLGNATGKEMNIQCPTTGKRIIKPLTLVKGASDIVLISAPELTAAGFTLDDEANLQINTGKSVSVDYIRVIRSNNTTEYNSWMHNFAQGIVDKEYKSYNKEAYASEKWAQVQNIYDTAKNNIEKATDLETLQDIAKQAVAQMRTIEMKLVTSRYIISSVNEQYLKDGVIEYRDGGIPPYTVNTTTMSAIVSYASPYGGIALQAKEGNATVDASKLKWTVEQLDESKREPASIDWNTGVLTIKENGLIKVTATNAQDLVYGQAVILINLQLEGEHADDSGGANLKDSKTGASGAVASGNNVGNTGQSWIAFKGVCLDRLKNITLRTSAIGSTPKNINISLANNADKVNLIASGTVPVTGSLSSWKETTFTVDNAILANAVKDKNGLGTIYVQTNDANLDFVKLKYASSQPYVIDKIDDADNGKINVSISSEGSDTNPQGLLIAAVYDNKNALKKVSFANVSNNNSYTIEGSYDTGDSINLFVWSSLDGMIPLSNVYTHVYSKPKDIVVYSAADTDLIGLWGDGATNGKPVIGARGLNGYSVFNHTKGKNVVYPYGGKIYTFTDAWTGGTGGTTSRCLYFTPKSACKVTVVFDGTNPRQVFIAQDGQKLATGTCTGGGVIDSLSYDITDTSKAVYVYGGGSNKNIYAIIVEYN